MNLYPNRLVQSAWREIKPDWPLYLLAVIVAVLVVVGAFSLFEFWLERLSLG